MQKTYTVDFLTKKRAENNGEVPQYYVEDSHPAIIDKDTWEAIQLEMERRKEFCKELMIQKLYYATNDNPLSGRIMCGKCGRAYGRKVLNSIDDRLKRVIWQCNGKYLMNGVLSCVRFIGIFQDQK